MIDTLSTHNAVETYYTRGNLANSIQSGLTAPGKDATNVTLDDLAPVDIRLIETIQQKPTV